MTKIPKEAVIATTLETYRGGLLTTSEAAKEICDTLDPEVPWWDGLLETFGTTMAVIGVWGTISSLLGTKPLTLLGSLGFLFTGLAVSVIVGGIRAARSRKR